jgi:hypothetical protein
MAKTNARPTSPKDQESVAGYFRKVFKENPKLLWGQSNQELLRRWLADHPGEKEVPNRIRQSLSNIKSVLRKKGRKRKAKAQPAQAMMTAPRPAEAMPTAAKKSVRSLETLEEQIDDCLSLAKHLDREGLANVIQLLRRARNEVVWKLGQ